MLKEINPGFEDNPTLCLENHWSETLRVLFSSAKQNALLFEPVDQNHERDYTSGWAGSLCVRMLKWMMNVDYLLISYL